MTMTQSLRFFGVLLILLGGGVASAQVYWEPLLRRENLAEPLAYERIECFSSSGTGITNLDRGNYLGRDEFEWNILCDLEGPGVLTEFGWTRRNPGDQLRFRIFADDTTVWDVQARADSLCGRVSPFLPPLADSSAGWYWNYAPVPFQERLRITYVGNTMAYHGCAQIYDDGVSFASFRLPVPLPYFLKLDTMQSVWSQPARPALWNRSAESLFTDSTLAAYATAEMLQFEGAGVVRRLWLIPQDTTRSYLDRTVAKIYFDHNPEPAISAQLGMLFGCSEGVTSYASAFTGRIGDTLYFQPVMPFSTEFRVEIQNNVVTPNTNRIRIGAEIVELESDDLPEYRLSGNVLSNVPTRRYDGFRAAEFSGRGTFIGTFLEIDNTTGAVLEGDETLTADGVVVRAGVGTPEYFNGSYNWLAPNGQPALARHYAHGVVTVTNNDFAAYRYHVSDAVPFDSSLTLDFEVGAWGHLSGNYRSLSLAYVEPPRYAVRDQDSSRSSVGGEILAIFGRGLVNGRVLNRVLWNEMPLEIVSGGGAVADSVLFVRVRAPFTSEGIAPLVAEFNDGRETIDPSWMHRAVPNVEFRVLRDEIDGFAFAGDTLSIVLRGYPQGESARIIFEGVVLPWAGVTPTADGNGIIRGLVTMPPEPELLPEARARLTAEAVSVEGFPDALSDEYLTSVRLLRVEIERMPVVAVQGGTVTEVCATDHSSPDSLDPWGRMLAMYMACDTAGENVSFRFIVNTSGNYRLNYFFGESHDAGYIRIKVNNTPDGDSILVQEFALPDGVWERSDTVRGQWRFLEADTHVVTFSAFPRLQSQTIFELILDQIIIESEFHQEIPSWGEARPEVIANAELLPPYPNPFNASARLKFVLDNPAQVRLEVFNLLGQRVLTPADEFLAAGVYEREFSCAECASGLYLARLSLPNVVMTRKMLLIK